MINKLILCWILISYTQSGPLPTIELRQQCCAPSPVNLPGEVKSCWWWEPSEEHPNTTIVLQAQCQSQFLDESRFPDGSFIVSLPRSLIFLLPRPARGYVKKMKRRQESKLNLFRVISNSKWQPLQVPMLRRRTKLQIPKLRRRMKLQFPKLRMTKFQVPEQREGREELRWYSNPWIYHLHALFINNAVHCSGGHICLLYTFK